MSTEEDHGRSRILEAIANGLPVVMSADDPIDIAVDGVADGKAIDWNALAARIDDDQQRQRLECLRIVDAIAGVHRSTHPASYQPSPVPPSVSPGLSTTPPNADSPHETWGRYRLLEILGAGTFGRVYRAWDPELEFELAIKILHGDADGRLKERLLREGRALAKVRDPNVVSVYGVESHREQVGLCMELIRGETLADVLRNRQKLSAREAVLVGQDVCRALAAVHRAGFVHRDVKARNIMRERAGRIVLMDFGTGRDIEELQSAGGALNLAGTPLYMAPEVLAGQPATFCSDIYSVGVLLYHLVTGRYPIEGRTLEEIRSAHMLGKRTPISDHRSDLPTAFLRVVDRALTANPHHRCSSAGELLEALAVVGAEHLVDRVSRTRAVLRLISTLAAMGAGLTLFGAVSSRYFNAALGRSEFANEGVRDWLGWGARSTVGPAVLFVFALFSFGLLLACRRFALNASQRARDFETRIKAIGRRMKLDEVENLSSLALLLSVSVLTIVWWYFVPLLSALMILPDVSTAPAEQLALLSPHYRPLHEAYRASFTWVTILCLIAWYPALRLAAKRREPLNRGLLAGGVAVVLLSVLLLDFPYRMLRPTADFEVAQWRGARCYVLGGRRDDVLLFCPRLEPPRNRVVSSRAEDLKRLGVNELIFTQFSPDQRGAR
jgi:hypothetical protein